MLAESFSDLIKSPFIIIIFPGPRLVSVVVILVLYLWFGLVTKISALPRITPGHGLRTAPNDLPPEQRAVQGARGKATCNIFDHFLM